MKFVTAGLLSMAVLVGLHPAWAGTSEALERIQREPNRQRRARLALDHAASCVDRAGRAYDQGAPATGEALLEEIEAAVKLAKASLDATGKNPSSKPKHFKRAEIATRKLIVQLDDLETRLGFDDRKPLQAVRARISEINGEILMGIMAKKR